MAQEEQQRWTEQEVAVDVEVVNGCAILEDRWEVENAAGMDDDQDLVESQDHQEGQNTLEAEVRKVQIQGQGQSRRDPEAGHSLCQTGREDSSRRREEDGGSLAVRKGPGEVVQVVMRSRVVRRR